MVFDLELEIKRGDIDLPTAKNWANLTVVGLCPLI